MAQFARRSGPWKSSYHSSGTAAIDAELARAQETLALGRYVPAPDHLVHPDVSLGNCRYFGDGWRRAIGAPVWGPRFSRPRGAAT